MAITFHMLKAGAKASVATRDRIQAALCAAADKAQLLLPSFNVDVVVFEDRHAVIPRVGVNGNSYHAHKIDIIYDSEHPHFQTNLESECQSVIVHELHHHARPDYGSSLGERFVSEGLACCFEEECGCPTPFYAVECQGTSLSSFAERALPLLARKDLAFDRWMFGVRDKNDGEFPYQCGYSLGYALVKAWLSHSGTTAAKAYRVDAEVVANAWRSGAVKPEWFRSP